MIFKTYYHNKKQKIKIYIYHSYLNLNEFYVSKFYIFYETIEAVVWATLSDFNPITVPWSASHVIKWFPHIASPSKLTPSFAYGTASSIIFYFLISKFIKKLTMIRFDKMCSISK